MNALASSRILALEAILRERDADVLREQRSRGEAVARADVAEAKVRRMARMLDESRPGWREEDRRATGGAVLVSRAVCP